MPAGTSTQLIRILTRGFEGRMRRWVYAAIFLAVFAPGIVLAWFAYHHLGDALTEATLERRQSVAHLSALTLQGRLDNLIDVGQSLATRVRFQTLVAAGQWDEAAEILQRVTNDFPFIERLFLADVAGTEMADSPARPGAVGKNFAHRDWYKGVVREWKPYISEAYKRAAEPQYNIVATAIPIKDAAGTPVGILVMQIRLRTLFDWLRDIDIGQSGFVYAVDQYGHAVAHQHFSLQEEISDFSSVPVVRRVLRGERGVTVNFNPLEETETIAAYEPVPRYGWAVVAQQPAREAFALRDATLNGVLLVYGVILLLSALAGWAIIAMLRVLHTTQNELTHHAAELTAVNKELEAFSYSVSHDLRAPLRAVDGFSQAVLEDCAAQLPAEGHRYLNLIRGGAQRMGQLIDDLLTFSRLSRLPLNRRTVDTSAMVREVLIELDTLRHGRRVDIRIGDLPACQADPALLKQVWINLLSNALKYSRGRDPAIIEVGCLKQGGETVYFVRDNGTGFDMKYVDKLFEVFQRLHHVDEFEGTGVGLAIVQRVVHRHGGRIWAEAVPDQGAVFYFTLEGGA